MFASGSKPAVLAVSLVMASGAALAQSPAAAPAAPAYPFVGTWNCEVATFTFTDRIYNNGSENLPIRKVTRRGKAEYQLAFDKGYRIVVQVVNARTMNWLSEASGDGFTCKRLK